MGRACSRHEKYGKERTIFGRNLKERYHFRELDVDGLIILKCIFKKCVGIVA